MDEEQTTNPAGQNSGNQGDAQTDDIMKKINLLSESVYEALFGGDMSSLNMEIVDQFGLSGEQRAAMLDINLRVAFKELRVDELAEELEYQLEISQETARQIALVLLIGKFYRAKDYFPGIDDAILALGGELPKEMPKAMGDQFVKREEEIEEMEEAKRQEEEEKMADTVINGNIVDLIAQYPELGEMVIGTQPSISVKNMPVEMKPMIKYWIQDYKEKTGYYNHSNLDRIQYVCHDKNTRNMNEEERRELNLILKSVDGEIQLPYSTRLKKIDFSLVEEE